MDTSPNRQRAVDESSLLKKKLREEETSYSQLLTECRMQRALQLIVIHGFSIKRVAVSCGYHSVSYFIYVFRNYYGMTPTEYQERSAQRLSNRDSAASIVAQGNFTALTVLRKE